MRTRPFARLIFAAGAAAVVAACGTTADAARDVTIPSGTILRLTLSTSVASDTSQVEDAVAAELRNAVMVGDRTALPPGARVRFRQGR